MTELVNNHDSQEERDTKAQRLAAFVGPLGVYDNETVSFWRKASSAEHASAMCQLSVYAEQMASQTGLGKDPSEMFPGFPTPQIVADNRTKE